MKRSSPLRAHATVVPTSSAAPAFSLTAGLLIGLLVLAAIFFSYRAQDVGQLPTLLASFASAIGQAPLFNAAVLGGKVASVLFAALIVFAWFGLGHLVTRWINPEANSFTLFLSWQLAMGASLWSLSWFALGTAGLLHSAVAVGMLVVGVAMGGWALAQTLREKGWASRTKPEPKWFVRLALAVLALPLLLGFIASLAPATGKDALVYRLAVPQAYVAAGGIVDVTTNVYGYLAFGAEMHGVWALLLGKLINAQVAEAAFGAVAFAWWPVLLLAVYGVAREWQLERAWALTATVIVAAMPSFYQVAATGYVDHTLALYVVLAVQATGQWWTSLRRVHLVCLAFALSSALAIKFIALFAFFPLLLVVLAKAREMQQDNAPEDNATDANAVLLSGLAALVLAGVLASPWYIRTWVRTGSPLYPFYAHLWPGSSPNWDAERSRLFQMWVSRYGGEEKTLVDYVAAPVKLSLLAQPEVAAYYDGVIGISLLLGLPLLVWGVWRWWLSPASKIACAVGGGWFLCWLFTSEQLRFLLPALPLLALALMVVSSQLATAHSFLQGIWLTSALPGLLVTGAWFCEQNPLRAVLGGEARADYLTRRLEHLPYYQIVNHDLPATARVWLINMRNDTVHLERAYFADYIFEDYTLTKLVQQTATLSELRAKVQALGVTHLLLRHDVLLDYRRTPIVDERKPEAENQAKLQLLKSFLTEGTTVLKSDGKFMLVQL